jgi:predicted glycosyltransferase
VRIWVDLTNSPHVLVLRPVIAALREDGHQVDVTARDFAQTLALLERYAMPHTEIGRHRGERRTAKALGLLSRSAALWRWSRGRGFELAIGHGSNDITIAAKLRGIPSVTMFDYEWAREQHSINCRWAARTIVPDAIDPAVLDRYGAHGKVFGYPGLKEEYYLSDFEPDAAVIGELGLDPAKKLVLLRTPPDVSLYHRHENELFPKLIERLAADPDVQVVALPRTAEQRAELERAAHENIVIPQGAVDGPSLVALVDAVIGAGGTMNREAVALGTPVWTTFAGRLGAVDERLLADGRLNRLDDLDALRIVKRGAPGSDRVRRDPRVLAALALGAARAADG